MFYGELITLQCTLVIICTLIMVPWLLTGLEDKIPSLYGMVKVGLDGTQGFVLDELMTRNNQPADAGCLRCGARQQESLVIQN